MESESSSRSSTDAHLRVGVVGRPHGKEGAFVVVSPTERIELLDPTRTVTIGGSARTVEWRRGTPERPLLKLEGADGRAAAEELRGEAITVPRAAVGPLSADEFLVDDLVGAEVVSSGGRRIGRVKDVLLMPSADLLEVERDGGDALLVPLVGDAVRSVEVAAGRIEIDLAFVDAD
jgi:16S rRNA processing protein RimM